ncbi:hypothetical protein [Helicobacter sp. MIT 01-3238]|uniref:hypothetical protein n=1 Tax=Helicobacter sp. MIT 01-3238 TaxID=398627 RepID=UPI000E1FA0B6|nr:hypothetical protein [Helicobacter sp. MIT 01-3238]RDU53405.1 hypothetical protein CQA40_05490 [Helicobacter sp. MIT 01-3238]
MSAFASFQIQAKQFKNHKQSTTNLINNLVLRHCIRFHFCYNFVRIKPQNTKTAKLGAKTLIQTLDTKAKYESKNTSEMTDESPLKHLF